MIKAHKGPPPAGWENVPGLVGFIREKRGAPSEGKDMMSALKAITELEMAKAMGQVEKLKGEPGKDATPEMVAEQVLLYLRKHPPKQGEPGKDATPEMVDASVRAWLQLHPPKPGKDGENVTPEMVSAAVNAWLKANPPRHGKDASDAMVKSAVAAWFKANPQEKGKDGVGIKEVKSFGSDVQIELTDGRKTKFRIAGGGGGTPFGGGGGGGGQTLTPGDGIEIDGDTISVKRNWTDYVTRWDVIPELTGTATAPVAGDVYTYILGGVTRFRLVPTAYTPVEDVFYGAFAGGACSDPLAPRIEP